MSALYRKNAESKKKTTSQMIKCKTKQNKTHKRMCYQEKLTTRDSLRQKESRELYQKS